MIKRIAIGFGLLIAGAALLVAILMAISAPGPLPAGTASAARYAAAPYEVASTEFTWVDSSRGTAASGDYPGAASRTLPVTVWYPVGASGPGPLVVYSHGFLGTRTGGRYIAEYLAARGYVVAAPEFPLSSMTTPGDAVAADVVNQPADVAFVIDQMLATNQRPGALQGLMDPGRIGAVGLSLGGLTTTLAAFHREWRDPRIQAAISLAGPADVFGPKFFDTAAVPFLMVGGTLDAIVNYGANAAVIPARIRAGGLLTLERATHIGFDQFGGGWIRIFGNADGVVCTLVGFAAPASDQPAPNPFNGLFGGPDLGILDVPEYPPLCTNIGQSAMATPVQQQLTQLAVHAFFASYFTPLANRPGHAQFLRQGLANDFPAARWTEAQR